MTAFTDKLQVISDLKAIEGYILIRKRVSSCLPGEAAARFDESGRGFEGEFLNLSQQEATSVEMASFLMGQNVFSQPQGMGQATAAVGKHSNTYFYLNHYPLFLELLVARYSDLLQTALDVKEHSTTTLAREDVLDLRERLWAMIAELQQRDEPPQETINYILFDNLETFDRVSKERNSLTYASLRLVLHALIAGRLLGKWKPN